MFIKNYFFGKSDEIEKISKCPNPISLTFFPKDLLVWNPKEDYNLPYDIVKEPIRERTNKNKNKCKIVGCFSQKTSNQLSQGTNEFNIFIFDFWQYIDIYCYFAGSASEGLIVPPAPYWIRAAHKNGVKIYGTIFFPPDCYGGDINWVKQLIYGESYSNDKIDEKLDDMLGAKKLIELTNLLGFDGWFIDQETSGGTLELGQQMQKFLSFIQDNSNIEIMWYDAMILNGEISYQNELNNVSCNFFEFDNKTLATNFFSNYWWNKQNLETSFKTSIKLHRSNFNIYTGINCSVDGFGTENLIYDIYNNGNSFTSIGLYGANWTYDSKETYKEFNDKQIKFWNLIDKYKTPNSSLITLPFVTHFNTGQGKKYFINGQVVRKNNWNDISQQDIMPTWRNKYIENNKSIVYMNINYDDAYTGGSSMEFIGELEKDSIIMIDLYKTQFNLHNIYTYFEINYKYIVNNNVNVSLVLSYGNENENENKKNDINIDIIDLELYSICNLWNTKKYHIKKINKNFLNKYKKNNKLNNDILSKISIKFTTENLNLTKFKFLLGGIKFRQNMIIPNDPSNAQIICSEIKENNGKFYQNVNIEWNGCTCSDYYYLTRNIIKEDEIDSKFIAKTFNTIYHINEMEKIENEKYSIIEIKSVSNDGSISIGSANINIYWKIDK